MTLERAVANLEMHLRHCKTCDLYKEKRNRLCPTGEALRMDLNQAFDQEVMRKKLVMNACVESVNDTLSIDEAMNMIRRL